jgi:transposase InsO family protein
LQINHLAPELNFDRRIWVKTARRSICLATLDLSLSRFKRWKRERKGCAVSDLKNCPKYSPNQLTFQEIQLMGDFVTSEKYSHFPIRSLQLYTQRKGLLFCTYSSWTKYISLYGWLRPRKKKRKKCIRIGIRAKHPNEIWHIDVSHFIFPNGQKAFIQVVIDNFSRYVLAWQVLSSYDGAKTAALLEQALKRSTRQKLRLVVDGGSENKGPGVEGLELDGAFTKQVARFEISYSNSMVEALFRQLKNNYLYSQKIDSVKSLTKHAKFWFREHNDVIPHTAFEGETPLERFKENWDKDEEVRILVRHEEAIKLRISHNQKVFCKLCEVA